MDTTNVSFDDLVNLGIWGNIGIDLLLLMYRVYTTPDIFLATIIALYYRHKDEKNDPQSMRKIDKVFKDWINSYFDTDLYRTDLSDNILEFYRTCISNKEGEIKLLLEHQRKLKRHTSLVLLNSPREQDKLILGENDNIDLKIAAEQLTLIEAEMIKNIKPIEFMDNAWMKDNKKMAAPNIIAIVVRFNSVSAWVSTEVLQATTVYACVKMINKFITLMDHLLTLNNFNSLAQVYCGLNNVSISRLNCIWSKVSKKYKKIYDGISEILMGKHNFKTYRGLITYNTEKRVRTIPYIALFLKDITFINDGNPNYTDRGINLEKVKLLGSSILNFRLFQNMDWRIDKNELYDTLLDIPFRNENFLRRRSAEFEPTTSSFWTNMIDPKKIDFMEFTKIKDLPHESPRLRHSVSKEFDLESPRNSPRDSPRSLEQREEKDKIRDGKDNHPIEHLAHKKTFAQNLMSFPRMIRNASKEKFNEGTSEKKMKKSRSREFFSLKKN